MNNSILSSQILPPVAAFGEGICAILLALLFFCRTTPTDSKPHSTPQTPTDFYSCRKSKTPMLFHQPGDSRRPIVKFKRVVSIICFLFLLFFVSRLRLFRVLLASPLEIQRKSRSFFRICMGSLRQCRCHESGSAQSNQKLKIGAVLSRGPAPGGHNVICGMFDYLQDIAKGSTTYGFKGGPAGILKCNYVELNPESIYPYRNQGGFDMICSGRDKIETPYQATLITWSNDL